MANRPPRFLSPAFLLALLLVLACLPTAWADDPRKPIIYGISQKPFPLLIGLEYPLCRAEAWLAALDLAATSLPSPLFKRLRSLDLDTALGRLALSALLCPLDVATPENADSEKIRVFLVWPTEPLDAGLSVMDHVQILRMEMALIWEMQQAVKELRAIWPHSTNPDQKLLDKMAHLSDQIDDLWRAVLLNNQEMEGKQPRWAAAFQRNKSSAALQLRSAQSILPSSTGPLDYVLDHLTTRETVDADNRPLWNPLAAQTLILRSRVHSLRDSLALAESDLKSALARLKKTDLENRFMSQIWLELGSLYEEQGKTERMCKALEEACAKGECQRLSLARRSGVCNSTQKPE